MVSIGRGKITQRSDGPWFVGLPKAVCEDTNFPFEPGEHVRVYFEKNALVIEKFPETVRCITSGCSANAKLQRTTADGVAYYKCETCDLVFPRCVT